MKIKINTPFFIQFQEYQIVLIFKDIFLGKKVQRQLIKIDPPPTSANKLMSFLSPIEK